MGNFVKIVGYWIFVQRMKLLSLRMRLNERFGYFVAWLLPRSVAGWAFIRVATDNYDGNPGEQTVGEVMNRWIRNDRPN